MSKSLAWPWQTYFFANPDDLEKDWESQDDDMIYSLDEIQELKKKEEEQNRNQAQGPEISETHMQQVRPIHCLNGTALENAELTVFEPILLYLSILY